jgi:UDP-N-acetyl-D-mannosaminuronate dehydrogenase
LAAVVADSKVNSGKHKKYVIGMQRPSIRSYWKIPIINRGLSPVKSEDPDVDRLIKYCVIKKKNFNATYTYEVLSLADVVVVDVQFDYLKEDLGNVKSGKADVQALEESIGIICCVA